MHWIFQKKGKKKVKKFLKRAKKSKIFENLGKNVQNLKIFGKRDELVEKALVGMNQSTGQSPNLLGKACPSLSQQKISCSTI